MATKAFLNTAIVMAVSAFVLMFVAFASPFWYKSWTRVHSSFGNIGLWHVCLNGYIMPRDPVMKSYVGCWWIHSSEFSAIKNDLQPAWFRFIQAFCIFSLVADLLGAVFTVCYIRQNTRNRLYKKRPRMFFINSALMLGSAFLVFLISLVFAEKSNDSDWMPRPWMNYLSWSYGLCVLSGFFAAFSGMCLFILAIVFKDKEDNGDPGVTSAAEMARKRKELEKQDEAMRSQPGMIMDHPMHQRPHRMDHHGSGQVRPEHHGSGQVRPYGSGQVYQPQYHQQPAHQYQQQPAHIDKTDTAMAHSVAGSAARSRAESQSTRVGESFV